MDWRFVVLMFDLDYGFKKSISIHLKTFKNLLWEIFCFPNCGVYSSPLFKEDNTPVSIMMIGSEAFNNSSDFDVIENIEEEKKDTYVISLVLPK